MYSKCVYTYNLYIKNSTLSRHFLVTRERRSRAFLKERSHVLGRWFVQHFTHPYPSKEQKDKLASTTNMSRNQVKIFFNKILIKIY